MIIPKELLELDVHPIQKQPCGIDLTVASILAFKSAGTLDFDNRKRVLSACEEVPCEDGVWRLQKGAYKIVFGEYVHIPKDRAALCFPRSSLLRCGATLCGAVWDPGYEGRGESLLLVENPHGINIHKGARIAQLIFIKLVRPVSEGYEGRYKGENLNLETPKK